MLTWRHSGDSKEGKTVLNISMTVSLLKITLIAICSANSYQLKSKRWMESRFFFHIYSAFHNSNPKSFVKSIDCLKNSYNSCYFNISAFCLLHYTNSINICYTSIGNFWEVRTQNELLQYHFLGRKLSFFVKGISPVKHFYSSYCP